MADEKKKGWLRGALDKVEGKIGDQKALYEEGLAKAGNLSIEKNFGPWKVSIYDAGYVRVASSDSRSLKPAWMIPFEVLKSITYREQVEDRSALEKGSNLGFGSPQKRRLSLTIATDRKVHTLTHEKTMMDSADKSGMALEAAGQAVLGTAGATSPSSAAPATSTPDAADQIKKLADLHAAGVLTDDEFNAKKAELLDRM